MIYIRGDVHGELHQFSEEMMPGESTWTSEDVLLITGDFGFVFHGESRYLSEKNKLNSLANKPYTILFIDGNHEGFPYLQSYPQEIRFGAPVRRIRKNIFWLQRGYLYYINGLSFFTMGGAYSIDKAYRLQYLEHYGEKIWFEEELPNREDYHRAIQNLDQCGRKVDYILTHTAPYSIIPQIISTAPDKHEAELTRFLDWIYDKVNFKKWFFGHFHKDIIIDDQIVSCYKRVYSLEYGR